MQTIENMEIESLCRQESVKLQRMHQFVDLLQDQLALRDQLILENNLINFCSKNWLTADQIDELAVDGEGPFRSNQLSRLKKSFAIQRESFSYGSISPALKMILKPDNALSIPSK